MPYLLDTNALIALIDPKHVHHRRTVAWFISIHDKGWLTCPIVENGAVRIMSHRSYSERHLSAGEVARTIRELQSVHGYRFVPDDISLTDSDLFNETRLLTSGQVTDSYLLALAARNNASLATHDRRLVQDAVRHLASRVSLIPPSPEGSMPPPSTR